MTREPLATFEPKNFTLSGHEHLRITLIETRGNDVKDMLSNAAITLENWNGGEGPEWDIGDLSDKDIDLIAEMFAERLAGA